MHTVMFDFGEYRVVFISADIRVLQRNEIPNGDNEPFIQYESVLEDKNPWWGKGADDGGIEGRAWKPRATDCKKLIEKALKDRKKANRTMPSNRPAAADWLDFLSIICIYASLRMAGMRSIP